MTPSKVLAGMLLALLMASFALACRYTVRDIGFVRLNMPEARLVFTTAADDIDSVRIALADVPLEIIVVDPRLEPTHPGVLAAHALGTDTVLIDPQGRAFAVEDPFDIGHGPIANQLASEAPSTFAHVLLLLSGNESNDTAARAECERLQASLDAIEVHLPRPLGHPLRSVALDRDAQLREGALLWSLGVDAPVSEPTVLVLYGRARRAGDPVLITPETRVDASRELLAQLALVGESCECDTSRAWTEEPAGLVPWTRTTHTVASKSLGFDPESPLVRNEVVRILGQPPAERSGKKPRPQSLEELLLGYGETTLAPIESTPAETSNDGPERDTRSVAPPARVVGGTDGDDWSFGESSTNETRTRETDSGGSQASRALWIVSGVSILAILVALVLIRRPGVGP